MATPFHLIWQLWVLHRCGSYRHQLEFVPSSMFVVGLSFSTLVLVFVSKSEGITLVTKQIWSGTWLKEDADSQCSSLVSYSWEIVEIDCLSNRYADRRLLRRPCNFLPRENVTIFFFSGNSDRCLTVESLESCTCEMTQGFYTVFILFTPLWTERIEINCIIICTSLYCMCVFILGSVFSLIQIQNFLSQCCSP